MEPRRYYFLFDGGGGATAALFCRNILSLNGRDQQDPSLSWGGGRERRHPTTQHESRVV